MPSETPLATDAVASPVQESGSRSEGTPPRPGHRRNRQPDWAPRRGPRLSLGAVGLTVFLLIVLACVLAPVLSPDSPNTIFLNARLRPPSFQSHGGALHLLGTDELGRDLLTRMLYGGRLSLFVSAVGLLTAGIFGTTVGLVAGYFGGVVDLVVMRVADIQLGIPSTLLAVVVVAALGPSTRNLVVVLAVSGWVDYARVTRSRVLATREDEYVLAARIIGAGNARRMFNHILPNVMSSVLVIANLQLANMILLEASLSFLGLGVQPPNPSWGNIVAEGQPYLANAWWIATVPGIAIALTVVSVTVCGDWLSDKLDPRGLQRS
jgi:peptide/nickel transport system permease protein